MCIFKRLLPVPDIKKFERFLFVAAHAGDIEKAAGGTVAMLIKNNKKVKFLLTTDSQSLVKNEPDEQARKEKRQKEELASAMILGVKEIEFLPFTDGGRYEKEKLAKEIAKVIADFKPEVVFADDISTPNEKMTDDVLTTQAIEYAFEYVRNEHLCKEWELKKVPMKALCYYNSVHPNYYMRITGAIEQKINSIMVQTSLLPEKEEDKLEYYRAYKSLMMRTAFYFGCKSGKILAEGFRVVGNGSLHNVPQINF